MRRSYRRPNEDIPRNFSTEREAAQRILVRRQLRRPATEDFRIPTKHADPQCLWDNCPNCGRKRE